MHPSREIETECNFMREYDRGSFEMWSAFRYLNFWTQLLWCAWFLFGRASHIHVWRARVETFPLTALLSVEVPLCDCSGTLVDITTVHATQVAFFGLRTTRIRINAW